MKLPSDEAFEELVQKIFKLFYKNKHIELNLQKAWIFSNSAGSIAHVTFDDGDETFYCSFNGRALDIDKRNQDDIISGCNKADTIEDKLVLRVGYILYRWYQAQLNKRQY